MIAQNRTSNSHVNLNPHSEDCYYFFYSECLKGDNCHFRHSSAALGNEEVCSLWKNGICTRTACAFRHVIPNRQRSSIPCYWENQASGCTKAHCPFMHLKPRSSTLPSLQERIKICNMIASTEKLSSVKVKSLDEILAERHSSASIENVRQVNRTTNNDQLSIGNTGIGDEITTNRSFTNDVKLADDQKPKKKILINRKRQSTSLISVTEGAMYKNPELCTALEASIDLPSPSKKEERTEGSPNALIPVKDQIESDLAKFAKQKDDLITDNDIEELLTDNAGMCDQADDSHNDDDLILELEEFHES